MSISASNSGVSVILTVCGRIAFLREAIQGALAQTLAAREIIVADDSNSAEIRAICDTFPRDAIRYRANATPLGVALNVRAAVAEARGEFIAILNDDDFWEPDFLATLATSLTENPQRALAFCDHWIMREDGSIDTERSDANTRTYRRDKLVSGEVRATASLVIETNSVPLAMGSLLRKNAIDWDKLAPQAGGAYDFWIACLFAATRRPFFYTARRLTRYRVHRAMETARRLPDRHDNMAWIYHALMRSGWFPEMKPFLRKKYANALFACSKQRLLFGEIGMARDLFERSLRARFFESV